MNCKLKATLKLKDGTMYPKGTRCEVTVPHERPTQAILKIGSRDVKVRSLNLWRYFSEFEKPDLSDECLFDSVMPSLTGDNVEPDGWDSEGFPSILLAAGMI